MDSRTKVVTRTTVTWWVENPWTTTMHPSEESAREYGKGRTVVKKTSILTVVEEREDIPKEEG